MTAALNILPGKQDTWRRAYGFAVANAVVFALLSAVDAALSVNSIVWEAGVASLFCLGSLIAFVRLARTGAGLAFIGFFVLGAGVMFGFGTAFATVVDTSDFRAFFPVWSQGEQLRNINLLNSVSVLIVLLTAWPLCMVERANRGAGEAIGLLLDAISRFQLPLMVISVVVLAAEALTLPAPSNLLLAGALRAVSPLPLIAITVTFARAGKSGAAQLAIAAAMAIGAAAIGLLREAKTDTILPLVGVAIGLWLNRRSRLAAMLLVAACAIGYFAVLAPLTTDARRHAIITEGVTNRADAVQYLSEGWDDFVHGRTDAAEEQSFVARLSAAPFQAFMIDQFNEGRPGDSLRNAWAAAVPRVLWADKPDVTRFGRELYGLVEGTSDPHSALAPTYTAEAYWNGGWVALVVVSIIVGLELGWLTRKWLLLSSGASRDIGILIMAIPAALFGVLVEAWIGGTYIGGFLTLAVLITILDIAGRTTFGSRRPAGRQLNMGYTGIRP
ncbi:MAG TPA: hypothetical protein VHZ26_19505 [Caulobacteraceae bacterium]|jgi:hypothetical protein|nr:hypothetical protein [Caulobacteraceae bacterium]